MIHRSLVAAAVAGTTLLAGCGGGATSSTTTVPLVSSMSRSAESVTVGAAVKPDKPKLIYVGFTHPALAKSKYGPVAFYAPTTGTGATKLIYVKTGAKVAFLNDDTTHHTASGLGTTSFPKSFDNTSGLNRVGTAIDSSLTWSTGLLNPGVTSQTFTVGPVGAYFFGCYYHYSINPQMRDVIVSQST